MDEKILIKTAIVVMIIGLSILYFYSEEISLEPVESIDTIELEEEVSLRGKVSSVSDYDTVIFIELNAEIEEVTDVILFKDEDIYLSEGDYVEIEGTVEEYEGEREIIANSITLLGK